MKRFSEQLNNKAKSIRLKAAEKQELRDRLVSYMEYHPLPNNMKQGVDKTISLEQTVRTVHVSGLRFLQWSGVMVAIFTLVIPYVAERAVPGDTLYAVKVHLNEEVRSTLARSSYEKIVWETELLNRRIAEARLLANEGRLTEETEIMVADAVRTHSENAKKEIENLKQTDKDEAVLASIQLDTALDVQTTSLRNSDHASTTEGMSVTKIATVLEESQGDDSTGVDVADLPSYDRLMGRVEIEGTRAHELLSSIKDLATVEEKDDIKRRLEDIGRKTDSAIKMSEESEADTRRLQLVGVLQQTQKLIVFMTNIDVRGAVTVNDIVPVTLTAEERLEIVKGQVDETAVLLERTNLVISTSTSAGILEKVGPASKKSKLLLEEVGSMLEGENIDIDKAESMVLEAFNLAKDAWGILEGSGAETDKRKTIKEEEVSTSTPEVIEEENPAATSTEVIATTTEEITISATDTSEVSMSTPTENSVKKNPNLEISSKSQV